MEIPEKAQPTPHRCHHHRAGVHWAPFSLAKTAPNLFTHPPTVKTAMLYIHYHRSLRRLLASDASFFLYFLLYCTHMAFDFSKLKKNISETSEHLSTEFSNIRTGRAVPSLLDSMRVEAYGTRTPLRDVASVSVEDARTLRVSVWDSSLLKAVEKAAADANMGVSTATDEQGIRVIFPDLSAERRAMLVKLVGEKLEQAKVTMRRHRADTLHELDTLKKNSEVSEDELSRLKKELQKYIDEGIELLESVTVQKQKEISL